MRSRRPAMPPRPGRCSNARPINSSSPTSRCRAAIRAGPCAGHPARVARDLILVITAHGSVETAVEAMRLGAHDYLAKPVDLEMLGHQVRKAFEHHRLREENRLLRDRLAAAGEFPEMIGQSAAIREVFECIRQVADTDLTV